MPSEQQVQKALGTLKKYVVEQTIKFEVTEVVNVIVEAVNQRDAERQCRRLSKKDKLERCKKHVEDHCDCTDIAEWYIDMLSVLTPNDVRMCKITRVEPADEDDIEYYGSGTKT